MTTSLAALRVHPIPPAELEETRRRGFDPFGNVPEEFSSDGGDQLRCCLRLSRPSEQLWVVAHAPLTVQRPWREVGPVFVHPHRCGGYDPAAGLPGFLGDLPLVVRSYTSDQAMWYPGNRTTSGPDLPEVLADLFGNPDVAEVHLRNVQAQCYIGRVTR